MQATVVEAQATAQCQVLYMVRHGGKGSDVEQPIGGYQILRTQVLRPLPHARNASRKLPRILIGQQIMYVVVHGVQTEVEPWCLSILILLTAVLLITHQHLQRALAYIERVVQQGFVVLYALKGIRGFQLVGLDMSPTFNHSRADVVVRQLQV